MFRKQYSSMFLLLVFAGSLMAASKPQIRREGDYVMIYQNCALKVKQTGHGFEFGGLDFTSTSPVTKVGSVKLDPKLLQAMTPQAQILDQEQYETCNRLNTIPLNDPKRTSFLAIDTLVEYQLAQLSLLAQMYSGNADKLQEALLKWMVSSSDLMQKVWEKQFTAADPSSAEKKQQMAQSFQYAVQALKLSPDSPEFKSALSDPFRTALQ